MTPPPPYLTIVVAFHLLGVTSHESYNIGWQLTLFSGQVCVWGDWRPRARSPFKGELGR